jgi:superfamily II DNA or RNA helicase
VAVLQELRSEFRAGTSVTLRGEAWRIRLVEPFERCTLLTLDGIGRGNLGAGLSVLTPFDRPRVEARSRKPRVVSRRAALQRAARAIAGAHAWSSLWTAASASIELLPWQLEPALAVIDGATRIILADAVGLGKTIQAGLVLAELRARGLVDRALILTPPGLRRQWRQELGTRFGIDAVELDYDALAQHAMRLPIGINPWAIPPVVVSSLDLVKRPEHLAAVEAVPFDFLLVDEAHHVTPGTDRGAMVARLARQCGFVALITATPHSGDEHAFQFLTAVGRASDALAVFRRTAADVTTRPGRRTRARSIEPTADEQAMLEAVAAYGRAIWRARGASDEAARLVAIVLARRAASSATALRRTLERRRALLTGAAIESVQPELHWAETEERDAGDPDAVLGAPGLDDPEEERRVIDRLETLAVTAAQASSKVRWLQRFLARTREPVVIFSEYRDTVHDLRERLRPDSAEVLHGGQSPAIRRDVVDRFVRGPVRALLATDAAGEGLNLHTRCRTVINAELPWNPVRLEQRIGRVDRIGQSRTVHAIHLFHRGSIEERVLQRLTERAQEAARAVCTAEDVGGAAEVRSLAESAFGGEGSPPVPAPRLTSARVERAGAEAARLETCRRLAALGDGRHVRSNGPPAGLKSRPPNLNPAFGGRDYSPAVNRSESQPRMGGRDFSPAFRHREAHAQDPDDSPSVAVRHGSRWRRILCVFEATAVDGLGRMVSRLVIPVIGTLTAPTRCSTRDLARSLAQLETLQKAVCEEAENLLAGDRARAARAALAYETRLVALIDHVRSSASQPVQASLFDGRATRRAAERTERRAARLDALERRREAARHLATVSLTTKPRLVSVFPMSDREGDEWSSTNQPRSIPNLHSSP